MASARIAIVGFGPRGLGALERLIAHQGTPASTPIEVTIFEPHPTPGAGSAYDPHQPPFLLMNFPVAKIDLNWKAEGPPSCFESGPFSEWAGVDPARAERWYPPRALVGRYLSAAAAELIDSCPFPVELLPESVLGMEPESRGWLVRSDSRKSRFDEVLLAVGHAPRRSTATRTSDLAEAGSRVGIRGFGLTAIDLILQLTEGRGGQFESGEGEALRYSRTGSEPSMIVPSSRHGRPMVVKPELARSRAQEEILLTAIEGSRDQVLQLPFGSGINQLGTVIASLCAELLSSKGAQAEAENWIQAAFNGRLEPISDPAGAIARSLRIASGKTDPDLSWALGLAWRSIYPAIVERFSHGSLLEADYVPFRSLAAELERLAFGPPPVNGEKLLALVEAGILDLSRLAEAGSGRTDTELDAVTEPPGLLLHQMPLADLVAEGAIRVPAGARGIEVTRAARCVGADGETTQGLAACGRLTEDWVIGNDTLDRSLHPEIDRWAATICAGTQAEPAVAVVS